MQRIPESEEVLHAIATEAEAPLERVTAVVVALRDAIDGLFLDGYTIFAHPFSLTYPNNPVASIFAAHVESASDAEIEAWHLGDMEATATWLGVPLSVYMRHPVASDLRVLIELLDALDIEDAESPEGTVAVAVAEAWFDTFREERAYRLGNVGLERDLEAWLIHHTERLVQIGYDVRLRRQQFVLPDRRRPDLVFDLTEGDGVPGTLIVELKATNAYLGAVDQLVGYMDAFASLGLANGTLRGLLVADGIPPDVVAYADEKGIDTATLTELGYRRDLAAERTTSIQSSTTTPEATSDDLGADQNGAPVTRVYNMFHIMDADQTAPQATLVFEEDIGGLCRWVSNEEAFATFYPGQIYTLTLDEIASVMTSRKFVPVPEDDPGFTVAIEKASGMEATSTHTVLFSEYPTLAPSPDHGTPVIWITGKAGHPPVSITAASESPVALALTDWARHEERQGRTVAEMIETFRGEHTWVAEGLIPDPAIANPQPVEDLISAEDGDLIPQWQDAHEINVEAMQAATDFVRAAGEIRKNLTYVPPRGLADWLSRNPERLLGDDELPEHIHAAADALEGLPAAILRDEVPANYDGLAHEFIRDSDRVLKSVTGRLQRITPLQALDQA